MRGAPLMSLLLAFLLSGTLQASAPVPETWPLCPTPQNISPIVSAGCAQIYARTAVAWSGKEYGTAWVDNADHRLHFRAFYADGTPVSPGVVVSSLVSDANHAPILVWNGTGYAACWIAQSPSVHNQAYFAKITRAGALVGSEVKASYAGDADTVPASAPGLAFSGSGYAVVWYDYRTGNYDVFATLLNTDGTVANGGVSHDLNLSSAAQTQSMPAVAWNAAAGSYVVAWQDYSSITHFEISTVTLSPGGAVGFGFPIISGTGDSDEPAMVDTGNGLGMAWYDTRDGNTEIYFCRLDASGYKVGTDLRLTNDSSGSYRPAIFWTGAEFGVLWYDGRGGGVYNVWFQRVTISGALPGGALNKINRIQSASQVPMREKARGIAPGLFHSIVGSLARNATFSSCRP